MTEARYPEATPFPGSHNRHGEIEKLGSGTGADTSEGKVEATHWFIDSGGISWHAVTAGDPSAEAVVLLHGFPESWWAFHNQIEKLADSYFVVAPDTLGNGQSDKRLDLDYDYAAVARALVGLFAAMGLERFNLVAHDRGAVIADHLCAIPGMNRRVLRYVRLQQSGNKPHGEPRPPHEIFKSERGVALFQSGGIIDFAYGLRERPDGAPGLVALPLDAETVERLRAEFAFPGVAEGASASFRSAGFDKELEDRLGGLFAAMTMPVLFLQGSLDPGQQPKEYETVTGEVANGRVEFIEAGHFLHLELPDAVTEAIRSFLSEEIAQERD